MTKDGLVHDQKTLTAAHEDYLKGIYQLASAGLRVNNSAIAQHLNVSPASTTNMIKRLGELGMVAYAPYQEISLTESGERVALEVLRHHRLIELYLHKKLNLPWDQVHVEAERLEHVLSEALEDAMAQALGDPVYDPHGDPIPTKDGYISTVTGIPMTVAELDLPYRLVRVLIQEPERLSYLGSMGLIPNAEVKLLKVAPFAGPLLVEVCGEQHALAHEMAQTLVVVPANFVA